MRNYAVFNVHPDAQELAALREGIRGLIGRGDGELNTDLLMAIHELVANAILHGCPTCSVLVHVAVDEDKVTATVADGGRGFDIRALLRSWPPAANEEHGRGIYLVTRLMDSVSIESGAGTIIRMSRRLNRHGDRTQPVCVWSSPTHARFSHPWLLRESERHLPRASG
jgi:anti-sigma regulatory factor (Ser/Thr protein kinase)